MVQYWLFSTTFDDWEKARADLRWAVKTKNIANKIRPNDIIFIHVNGAPSVMGAYKLSGDWWENKEFYWPEESVQNKLIWPYHIKMEAQQEGIARLDKLHEVLEFTRNFKKWQITVRGSPANFSKPISEADANRIINELKSNPLPSDLTSTIPIKQKASNKNGIPSSKVSTEVTSKILPKKLAYIPLILKDFLEVAKAKEDPQVFEDHTATLFTMLGFEVIKMGQGKGRIYDVLAIGRGNNWTYTLIIDTKGRESSDYTINAKDERTIIEYIKTYYRNNPEYRNIPPFYVIVSSGFVGNQMEAVKRIKKETKISGFLLMDANDLLSLLIKRLTDWRFDIDAVYDEIISRSI